MEKSRSAIFLCQAAAVYPARMRLAAREGGAIHYATIVAPADVAQGNGYWTVDSWDDFSQWREAEGGPRPADPRPRNDRHMICFFRSAWQWPRYIELLNQLLGERGTPMTWDDELREVIRRDFAVGQVFTLDQVYAYRGSFQRLHPGNKHVPDKLRKILQHLRDAGVVEFLDSDGRYRRLH